MNTLRWQKCTKQSDYRVGTTNAMLTTSTILKIINNGGIGQGLLFSKLDRCSNVSTKIIFLTLSPIIGTKARIWGLPSMRWGSCAGCSVHRSHCQFLLRNKGGDEVAGALQLGSTKNWQIRFDFQTKNAVCMELLSIRPLRIFFTQYNSLKIDINILVVYVPTILSNVLTLS